MVGVYMVKNINEEDLITKVIYDEKKNKFLVRYASLKEDVYEELNIFDDTYEKIIELVIKQYDKIKTYIIDRGTKRRIRKNEYY